MSACCDAACGELVESVANQRQTTTWLRRLRDVLEWLLPSAILVLMPKCPACLAAHVALWTGLGLSLSTATYLRWVLLLLCVAALLLLIAQYLSSIKTINSHVNKEIQQCNTK
jgi:hypothetical protein